MLPAAVFDEIAHKGNWMSEGLVAGLAVVAFIAIMVGAAYFHNRRVRAQNDAVLARQEAETEKHMKSQARLSAALERIAAVLETRKTPPKP